MNKFRKGKTNWKIVGATATIVFSLAASFGGALAWFASSRTVSASGMMVKVLNDSVEVEGLKLIKYVFSEAEDLVDYTNPTGVVSEFSYNPATGHERFEDNGGNELMRI